MFNKNKAVYKTAMVVLLLTTFATACSTVTVRPKGGAKDNSTPSYIDSKPFYFGGPFGTHKVDVNEVCEGNEVTQMQTVTTSSDWFFSFITLGVYTPRTAKVWCEEDQ
ncbi:MAG: Bor family protein [Acidiferrobacterales bacterium]|nr:Bor family protein [Acidiferrobacterales bacterium]